MDIDESGRAGPRFPLATMVNGHAVAIEIDPRTSLLDLHDTPVQLYGVADYLGTSANVRIETQGPGFMRAPHPHPACFAFEGAVDELAYKLGEDPLDFRLKHDTTTDPVTGRPLSSRFLRECLIAGARRFGWSEREPRADGTLVGWGVAGGGYPAAVTPNIAKLRVGADGTTRLALSGHEMGQGIRTVIAAVLHREFDIDPAKLNIVIGDTEAAPQHVTAGSWGTASVAPVAEKAARELMSQLAALVGDRRINGDVHAQLAAIGATDSKSRFRNSGPASRRARSRRCAAAASPRPAPLIPSSPASATSRISSRCMSRRSPAASACRVSSASSIAAASSRRALPRARCAAASSGRSARRCTRRPRSIRAMAAGSTTTSPIMSYRRMRTSARSRSVSSTGPTRCSTRSARKGLREVAMAGAAGAIANAIFHSTGRRLRRMPIRIEHLL